MIKAYRDASCHPGLVWYSPRASQVRGVARIFKRGFFMIARKACTQKFAARPLFDHTS